MKVLILTTKYRHVDGSPWLVSELAEGLSLRGHEVDVVNLNWAEHWERSYRQLDGSVNLFNFNAFGGRVRFLSVFFRWLLSAWQLLPFFLRALFRKDRYDLMIGFSPCAAFYSVIPLFRRISSKAFLIYWDFFPIHNYEISNKVPEVLLPVLKFLERKLICQYDFVGCMDDLNLKLFEEYYGVCPVQERLVFPVWTSFLVHQNKSSTDLTFKDFDSNSVVYVFGGQLTDGRGILELCDAFILANSKNPRVKFVVAGSGPLLPQIMGYVSRYPDVIHYIGVLTRMAYLDVLARCSVGVVSTSPSDTVSAFPSKSLDYMACCLPILAAVAKFSSFGQSVESHSIGRRCLAGDLISISQAIVDMSDSETNLVQMGLNSNSYLIGNHSVDFVVDLLVERIVCS